jgi:hypothetical protein
MEALYQLSYSPVKMPNIIGGWTVIKIGCQSWRTPLMARRANVMLGQGRFGLGRGLRSING